MVTGGLCHFQCPAQGDQGLVLAPEVCWAQAEAKSRAGRAPEPEPPEISLQPQEERLKPEVEVPEDRGAQLLTIVRPVHGPKRKPVA